MKIIGANITGSFILNSQDVTTTIQTSNIWSGSIATDITALNAATASLLNYTASNNAAISDILLETASFNAFSSSILNFTSSTNAAISDILLETASINLLTASLLSYTSSQNNRNGTYATTGSNTFAGIQTVNSNLVVTGSITAQTLVVQTITSSQDFVTGSTKFGSLLSNTHQFTGSVIVTGSLNATAFTGSGAGLTSIPNAALTNSTISGISLGSNLATLTIGTGLSGTSYNGSTGVTIANTITNNNQLTNGAGYITSAGTAAAINQTITAGSEGNLVFATVGTNDFFRIRAGGSSNAGFVEIATADDGTEPIYVRQYTGEFASVTRTATLLDGSGNTSFPGSLSASNLSGTNTGDQTNISGNAATATSATTSTNVASPDGDRNPSTKLPTTNARNVRFDFSGAGAVGGTGNYAGVMTYAPWDGTTASTGDSSYQLAFLNETGVNASGVPGLSIRNGIDSTWNAWYRIITSGNYGSYAVPLSGGSMSGVLNFGSSGATPYSNPTGTSNGIAFGGIEASSLRTYGIFTEQENIGGNYSKLTINYHTGVRIGAYYGYGGTRFYNNFAGGSGGGTEIFSVGNGDSNIRASNDIIAYASDRRLKHKIQPIENALNKVISLTGMTYQWNEVGSQHGWEPDTETREAGVFAQDVQEVLPEAVRLAPFDYELGKSKSGENFLTVKYDKIVPLLIEAIKEQQTQIEELKTIINGLTK